MMSNEEFLELTEKVYSFHKRRAPGIPIAIAMLQLLLERLDLKPGDKFVAFPETRTCLPDILQFLLGATIGNGDLRLDKMTGRYAMSVFKRKTKQGVRVYVDQNKIDPVKMPETYKFFRRKRAPEVMTDKNARKASAAVIVKEFIDNGRDIFGVQDVVALDTSKPVIDPVGVCSICGESYSDTDVSDSVCPYCSGKKKYYTLCGK